MQEDFLHYIWKFQKFSKKQLQTVDGQTIEIIAQGAHNNLAGPDFFTAQIRINKQVWAGNVEIHIKSSDWYAHHHESDPAYDNVILHVVWEHDTDVYRKDNAIIPTLELKSRITESVLHNYQQLFYEPKKWINCENDFPEIDSFLLQNWLDRLYFERLENKSTVIFELLSRSKNNWEAVLFQMLAKNFGLNTNGNAFLNLATSFDFTVLQKIQQKQTEVEALLFGQAGLLEKPIENDYYQSLQNTYQFLKNKYKLSNQHLAPVQFFRLRPVNFPTIRLAQLAALYTKENQLFSKLMAAKSKKDIAAYFNVQTSPFWDTHYSFTSTSAKRKKSISSSFIDLVIINTIAALKFCYAKEQAKDVSQEIATLIESLPAEKNRITDKFNTLKPVAQNALQSQALIELKNNYCTPNKCLQCAIGNHLIGR